MLGANRGVSISLVGWLWADILLGLFVIFLAASSAPTPVVKATPTPSASASATAAPGIDPQPFTLARFSVNGTSLLSNDPALVAAEQQRIATELSAKLTAAQPGRRAAMVLAYGAHEDPVQGDRLVRAATQGLRSGPFDGSTIKTYHGLVTGDRGSTITVEVYLYR